MRLNIDYLIGVDRQAPGLSRVQLPLQECLRNFSDLDVRAVAFDWASGKLLFPVIYGPLPVWLNAGRADVVHVTNSWYAHLIPLLRRPVVVTCHDLIEYDEIVAGERQARLHRRLHARASLLGLRSASSIVCDSGWMAQRILTMLEGLRVPIEVIYPGINAVFQPGPPDVKALTELGVSERFVLFVGSEQRRKNLPLVVAAFAQARRFDPDLQLVKVGGHQTPEGRSAFKGAIESSGAAQAVKVLDSVTDQQLVSLYRQACATVLPSWSEGFGFPPLEAMACGCPAIVSDRASLPEVTGGYALQVSPEDVEALTSAIRSLAKDSVLRQEVVAAGIEWTRSFTWDRAAANYRSAYWAAANGRCA